MGGRRGGGDTSRGEDAREERFNPDMLGVARDARKVTQTTLAKRAGVTQAALSMVENGLYPPSRPFVEQLATALNFPVSFFYQRDQAHGLPPYHYFRRKKLPAKMLSAIIAEINIRTMHIRRLLRSGEFDPPKTVPQYDLEMEGVTPGEVARRIREYWLLPRGPVKELTTLVEDSGCIIVLCNIGSSGIFDAVSIRHDTLPPLIFMDKTMPADRYNFTLAHEFGHLVMHTVPRDDKLMEREAHEFASNLLMPREDVLPYLADLSLSQLARIKPFWKVSIGALLSRAIELNLVSDFDVRDLWAQYAKAGYKRTEPAAFERVEPTALARLIAHHVGTLGYGLADLAGLLCITEAEFREMYLPRPRLRVVT
jgi:Zn-dependent peptidase ImmA (M78 family)/transcriptional regulator with XRE-family HTH domain